MWPAKMALNLVAHKSAGAAKFQLAGARCP